MTDSSDNVNEMKVCRVRVPSVHQNNSPIPVRRKEGSADFKYNIEKVKIQNHHKLKEIIPQTKRNYVLCLIRCCLYKGYLGLWILFNLNLSLLFYVWAVWFKNSTNLWLPYPRYREWLTLKSRSWRAFTLVVATTSKCSSSAYRRCLLCHFAY